MPALTQYVIGVPFVASLNGCVGGDKCKCAVAARRCADGHPRKVVQREECPASLTVGGTAQALHVKYW